MAISANNEEARNEEKVIQIMCEWRERGVGMKTVCLCKIDQIGQSVCECV